LPSQLHRRKSAAKPFAPQAVETIETARSLARQTGNLFDRMFGLGFEPPPTQEVKPLPTLLDRKQARAHLGELLSDVFGAIFCAVWRRGR